MYSSIKGVSPPAEELVLFSPLFPQFSLESMRRAQVKRKLLIKGVVYELSILFYKYWTQNQGPITSSTWNSVLLSYFGLQAFAKSKSLKGYFWDTIPIVVKCDFHSRTTVDHSHDDATIHTRDSSLFLLLWIFSLASNSHSLHIVLLLFCLLIPTLACLKSLLKQDDLTYRTLGKPSSLPHRHLEMLWLSL